MAKRNLITFDAMFAGSSDFMVSYNGAKVAVVGPSDHGFIIRPRQHCPRTIKAVASASYATREAVNTAILRAAQTA